MNFDSTKCFQDALEIVNESKTLADLLEEKREYMNKYDRLKRINANLEERKAKIKAVNEQFKNENYDSMTKMKYRRFRTDFQTKYKSLCCAKDHALTTLENAFNNEMNRINLISDETERRKKEYVCKKKYSEDRTKTIEQYKKILKEFVLEYRYTIATVGLKWKYISIEELNI